MSKPLATQALQTIGKCWHKASLTRTADIQHTKAFAQFVQDKFGLERIQNLKPGHVQAYVNSMQANNMGAGTISNHLSAIRQLAEAIGKRNIVCRTNAEYGLSRTRKNPVLANLQKIEQIRVQIDHAARAGDRIAMMCSAAAGLRDAFGLRAKESLLSYKVDGTKLVIEGTKGNRPRSLEITTDQQKQAVQYASEISQALNSGTGRIIPPEMSLKQAYNAQKNLWQNLGGTKTNHSHQHASRHAYAQGCKAAGDSNAVISEKLGHGRADVAGHYVP